MSTSVDQGSKAQPVQSGASGPAPGKEPIKDVDYDAYVQQHHQAAAMSNQERFVPNYYPSHGFPYLGDPAWSNGGDALSYLSYGQPTNEYMAGNGMFNPFDFSHGFAWPSFPSNDYNNWGAAPNGRKADVRVNEPTYDYYAVSPTHMYAAVNGEIDLEMRSLGQGLQAVNVNDSSEIPQERSRTTPESSEASRAMASDSLASASTNSASTSNCNLSVQMTCKKPMSWASVASQPAKSPLQQNQQHPRGRHIVSNPASSAGAVTEMGCWDKDEPVDAVKASRVSNQQARQPQLILQQQLWGVPRAAPTAVLQLPIANAPDSCAVISAEASLSGAPGVVVSVPHPVLEKLKSAHLYNPSNFDLNPRNPRFFIIKSYSEDDIHRSIKYNIWCSTDHGNKRLDNAYRERDGKGPVYLFFSVNGSGHFCGMAQMITPVDYNSHSGVWTQDKWKGQFEVRWIYVKDVPNGQLRHIRLENNENKPVTNSRDTQEVPPEKGKQVLKIIHNFRHTTSIFDDFGHYEKKQEEDESKKRAPPVGEY